MFHFKEVVFDYSEILNASNKEIQHIEESVGHNKIGHYRKEGSDIDSVSNLGDNIVPKHVLDNMSIYHDATHQGSRIPLMIEFMIH